MLPLLLLLLLCLLLSLSRFSGSSLIISTINQNQNFQSYQCAYYKCETWYNVLDMNRNLDEERNVDDYLESRTCSFQLSELHRSTSNHFYHRHPYLKNEFRVYKHLVICKAITYPTFMIKIIMYLRFLDALLLYPNIFCYRIYLFCYFFLCLTYIPMS